MLEYTLLLPVRSSSKISVSSRDIILGIPPLLVIKEISRPAASGHIQSLAALIQLRSSSRTAVCSLVESNTQVH
jgi:hypothetical protein